MSLSHLSLFCSSFNFLPEVLLTVIIAKAFIIVLYHCVYHNRLYLRKRLRDRERVLDLNEREETEFEKIAWAKTGKKCPRRESGLQPSAWTLHQLIYRRGGSGWGGGGNMRQYVLYNMDLCLFSFFFSFSDRFVWLWSEQGLLSDTDWLPWWKWLQLHLHPRTAIRWTDSQVWTVCGKNICLGGDWIQHGSTNGTSLLIHMICTTVGLILCEDQIRQALDLENLLCYML